MLVIFGLLKPHLSSYNLYPIKCEENKGDDDGFATGTQSTKT